MDSSASTTLYAWSRPVFTNGRRLIHTWVTSYNAAEELFPDIRDVEVSQKNYWYCWGTYHPSGGPPPSANGLLGSKAGNLALAKCLVKPNISSFRSRAARGTIFVYGRDGVCHQLANQVLYATGASSGALTVSNAPGYSKSEAIYGTYGLNIGDFAQKVRSCSHGLNLSYSDLAEITLEKADAFEVRVRNLLSDRPSVRDRFLDYRNQNQLQMLEKPPSSANEANRRNSDFMRMSSEILGPELYYLVFGEDADEEWDLVDPDVFDIAHHG